MPEYADVPDSIMDELRTICLGLPETTEAQAWAGRRWLIRNRTFAHVLSVDRAEGPVTVLTFRSEGAELDVLRACGHPFFQPGWGSNTVGMVLDTGTDFTEVSELLTDSYCILAPKKLAATIARPQDGE